MLEETMNDKKLKIGPHWFDLLYVKDLKDDEGNCCLGWCQEDATMIQIEDSMKDTKRAEVEIHEIIHGLLAHTGVIVDAEIEERIVQSLAPILTQFAQDNPVWLHDWIVRCATTYKQHPPEFKSYHEDYFPIPESEQ